MFILENQNIFAIDGKVISQIHWDYDSISKYIVWNYKAYPHNIIINGFFSQKKDWKPLDIKIDDWNHITMNNSLIDQVWHNNIVAIFGWKKEAKFYWDINIKFVLIKSLVDLYKNTIDYNTQENRNIYTSLSKWFYFENPNFKKIIWNYWVWVDKLKIISKAKAISEMIERLSASYIIWKSENIDSNKIYKWFLKRILAIYDIKSQNTSTRRWYFCHSWNLTTIPEEILFYPYYKKTYWIGSTSSGMATHITKKDATYWWLVELIERDAFLLFRLLKSWWYVINHNDIESKYKTYLNKLIREWYKITFIVLKFDNPIPVIISLTEKNKRTLVSLWTGNTVNGAIVKNINEIFGGIWFFMQKELWYISGEVEYHIQYYLQRNNYNKIEWVHELPIRSIGKIEQMFLRNHIYKEIISHYLKLNIMFVRFYYKNILNSAFKRHTIRIISDKLLPIYFGSLIPESILFSERLTYRKNKLKINIINQNIHPLG